MFLFADFCTLQFNALVQAEKSGVLSEMGGAQSMLDALHRMDLVFGIFYEPLNFKLGNNNRLSTMKDDEIPSEVVTLMKQVLDVLKV